MKIALCSIIISCILFLKGYHNASVLPGIHGCIIANNIYTPSTLDSMQGDWISMGDPLNKVFVKGRSYHELYVSRKDTLLNEFSRAYFSDTLVEGVNFHNIKIDTLRSSGQYLILRSTVDEGFWCYKIDGFFLDRGYHTFVITDTWAKQRETAFRKIKAH